MGYPYHLAALVRIGPIATVPLLGRLRRRGYAGLRLALVACRILLRVLSLAGLVKDLLEDLSRALCGGPKQQVLEPINGDPLFLQFRRQEDQGLDRRMQLGVFFFGQGGRLGMLQDRRQFLAVQVDPLGAALALRLRWGWR